MAQLGTKFIFVKPGTFLPKTGANHRKRKGEATWSGPEPKNTTGHHDLSGDFCAALSNKLYVRPLNTFLAAIGSIICCHTSGQGWMKHGSRCWVTLGVVQGSGSDRTLVGIQCFTGSEEQRKISGGSCSCQMVWELHCSVPQGQCYWESRETSSISLDFNEYLSNPFCWKVELQMMAMGPFPPAHNCWLRRECVKQAGWEASFMILHLDQKACNPWLEASWLFSPPITTWHKHNMSFMVTVSEGQRQIVRQRNSDTEWWRKAWLGTETMGGREWFRQAVRQCGEKRDFVSMWGKKGIYRKSARSSDNTGQ